MSFASGPRTYIEAKLGSLRVRKWFMSSPVIRTHTVFGMIERISFVNRSHPIRLYLKGFLSVEHNTTPTTRTGVGVIREWR